MQLTLQINGHHGGITLTPPSKNASNFCKSQTPTTHCRRGRVGTCPTVRHDPPPLPPPPYPPVAMPVLEKQLLHLLDILATPASNVSTTLVQSDDDDEWAENRSHHICWPIWSLGQTDTLQRHPPTAGCRSREAVNKPLETRGRRANNPTLHRTLLRRATDPPPA